MNTPVFNFQTVTFSDGTTIELEESDVVVLVGPNNAGKSPALKELEERIDDPVASKDVFDGDTDQGTQTVAIAPTRREDKK